MEILSILTILYDGVSWSFTSMCSDSGDYYKLEYDELIVIEEKEVPVTSPFRYIRNWLGHQRELSTMSIKMKMKVNVSQKETYGIRFHGDYGDYYRDYRHWWSDMQV
jgi:hypothetical protein